MRVKLSDICIVGEVLPPPKEEMFGSQKTSKLAFSDRKPSESDLLEFSTRMCSLSYTKTSKKLYT